MDVNAESSVIDSAGSVAVATAWDHGTVPLVSESKRSLRASRLAVIGRVLCFLGAMFGVLGFLGWIFEQPFLRTFIHGLPGMHPNTALCLLLLGLVGSLPVGGDANLLRVVAATACLVVLAIQIATLVEY